MIEFKKINEDYPMELLYLADPNEEAVDYYLKRGECWGAYFEEEVIGVYVLLPTRPFTAELVNLAVAEQLWRKGIGTKLVAHFLDNARTQGYKKAEVGTATIGTNEIAFYEKCGFQPEWIDRDFFVKHCPEPIFDHGKQCRDMIRMGMDL